MENWRNVEIPKEMECLPKDKRGYPIPFTIIRDKNGIADFSKHNLSFLAQCLNSRLCSICGQELGPDIWLVAGARVALEPCGAYIDPPLHKACATYALQVCPYLSMPSFFKKSPNKFTNEKLIKPDVFALVKTEDYKVLIHPSGATIILPVRPLLKIEYWKNGRQIPPSEALMLI